MKKISLLFFILFAIIGNIFGQIVPDFTFDDTCYGLPTSLYGSSAIHDTLIADWIWELDNDTSSGFGDANGKNIQTIFLDPSYKSTVKLKIVSKAGPTASISKSVYVRPLPDVNFIVKNACELQEAYYLDTSSIDSGSITTWQWDFHNNGQSLGSGKRDTFTNTLNGTYYTKLTCTSDQGCKNFAIKKTVVFVTPIPRFNVLTSAITDTLEFENRSMIIPDSVGSIGYNIWDFGDESAQSLEQSPKHKFLKNGTFKVQLKVISTDFCMDSISKTVTITSISEEDKSLVQLVNNIVTPNGDGKNDFLLIKDLANYTNGCEITVYNIWNDVVYSNSSYDNSWGGTYEGKQLDAGTYYYIINCDGKEKTVGSVSILK